MNIINMEKVYSGIYARIIGVIVVFQWIHLYVPRDKQFLYFVIANFLTDSLDSSIPLLFVKPFCTRNFHYQSWDKVLDLFTYILLIWYTAPFYSKTIFQLLWLMWVWRAYGVYQFILQKGEVRVIWNFPDMVNVVLVVVLLSKHIQLVRNNLWVWMLIGMFLKFKFERILHKKNYI